MRIIAVSAFGFKTLETLDIRLTQFHDSTIHALKRVESIKNLYIDAEYLAECGAHESDAITDRFLWIYRDVPSNLEVLHIKNCEITDKTLDYLPTACPSLKELNVEGTEITQNGLDTLKRFMPSCRVIHNLSENEW